MYVLYCNNLVCNGLIIKKFLLLAFFISKNKYRKVDRKTGVRMERVKNLGELLIGAGLITNEQLDQALNIQRASGKKLEEVLNDQRLVSEEQIIEALGFQLGVPYIDISKTSIDIEVVKLIDESLAKRYLLIPISKSGENLKVAMLDPTNIFAVDDIRISTGLEINPIIATKKDITDAIEQYYDTENAKEALEEFEKKDNILEEVEALNEMELTELNNAPVVKLVNSIIKQAANKKASDIHIEPFEKYVKVRFRIDGDLREIIAPSKSVHRALSIRIKIMAKMNIVEKRIPQDGRIEMMIDERTVDLRVSVLPTVNGEKIVIRLLDSENFMLSKKELGFTDGNLRKFDLMIDNPNGIILVTGPTGSGKSTTLYTVLRELNDPMKNIITVEEPVEYKMDGVNQVNVNSEVGLTFANALRSILRQDPDVIMIGEIRDEETAQIAVRAAITGHLVLSTMHTNDTASTIARLVDTGVEPYLVSSALKGIAAQRLVKKICTSCKIAYEASQEEKKILGMSKTEILTLYKGKGCHNCNKSGYKGRIAIHELLSIDVNLRNLIDKGSTTDELRKGTEKQEMTTLRENCIEITLKGITTIQQVIEISDNLS